MPSKLQFYSEFAERTARQITGSYRSWTAFLATAARLYKYPYNEQLMIYAQRPNATACAEYDFWKDRMGRYVQRGSTGIALIDASGYGLVPSFLAASGSLFLLNRSRNANTHYYVTAYCVGLSAFGLVSVSALPDWYDSAAITVWLLILAISIGVFALELKKKSSLQESSSIRPMRIWQRSRKTSPIIRRKR